MCMLKDIIRHIRLLLLHLIYRCRPELPISGDTLIVAPHPDDEVIGCAGLIQKLVEQGTPPNVIILTRGEGSHRGCCSTSGKDIMHERHKLTLRAAATLGLPESNIHCLEYPDGGISIEHKETDKLQSLLARLSPKAVFIPHKGEGWPDHVKVAGIIKNILKQPADIYEYCVWVWYYNVWNLDYKNARILKMSPMQHQRKLQATELYTTPLAPCGKPWSGVLPKVFLKAAHWEKELYFKANN